MPVFSEQPLTAARSTRRLFPSDAASRQSRPWFCGNRRVESGLAHLGARLDNLGVLHHGGRSFDELHGAVPVSRLFHADL